MAGSILALKGELGSGKTLFTQGLVVGLKNDAAVTSPTFTIVHEYQGGRLPVYHFDFFRLENRESADATWPGRLFFWRWRFSDRMGRSLSGLDSREGALDFL